MSTFHQVVQRLHDDANVSSYTSVCEQHIKLAINHYKSIPFWFNEAIGSMSVSQAFVAVPSDFLGDVALYLQVSSTNELLDKVDIKDVFDYRPSSGGRPTEYAYFGDRIEFNRSADQVYTVHLHYIKELTTLSASTDTNAWLTHGEDLILYHAEKKLAAGYFKDPELAQRAAQLERDAYLSLMRQRDQRLGTGYVKPYYP